MSSYLFFFFFFYCPALPFPLFSSSSTRASQRTPTSSTELLFRVFASIHGCFVNTYSYGIERKKESSISSRRCCCLFFSSRFFFAFLSRSAICDLISSHSSRFNPLRVSSRDVFLLTFLPLLASRQLKHDNLCERKRDSRLNEFANEDRR